MKKLLPLFLLVTSMVFWVFAQSNEWKVAYTTFDDDVNGTGNRTASVAVVGPNRFVALVNRGAPSDDFFSPTTNYIVGYWDADSANGRVPAPINGQITTPVYGGAGEGQFSDWQYQLEYVQFKGAWQMAADDSGYIYVANNDDAHNILVYKLTSDGVQYTPYRMETGQENIWGIEVDDSGYVYVVDYEGRDDKDDEIKVFKGIYHSGTNWGTIGAHFDDPIATIDLPPGYYQGITVSGDGSMIFVSATSERKILKFVGSPQNGYQPDNNFSFQLSPDDTVDDGGHGTPSVLGLAYSDDPPFVAAVVDTFYFGGDQGGYPYGRVYLIYPGTGSVIDTIDVAAYNKMVTGDYSTGYNWGNVGGYTSLMDVDYEKEEGALYWQTYYGWQVEKWYFDGDKAVLGIEQLSAEVPQQFVLYQNYPNPFNPVTTIKFAVQQSGPVTLNVYNISGQKVATLINNQLPAGTYSVTFDGSRLPSGIYFYQLTAGNHRATRKMILTK